MSVWTVAHEHGTTDVKVGDRYRDKYHPDEEWEVAGPPVDDIESDYGDGWCPVFPCRQLSGDTSLYSADRKPNGEIDMCGDAIAEALWRGTESAGAARDGGEG